MTRFRLLKSFLVAIALVVGAGLLGSLGIRLYGAYRLSSAVERFEHEFGSLSVRALALPKIAVEDNAATWQRPGVLAVVLFPGDGTTVGDLAAKPLAAWTAEDTAKLVPIMERNRPALELLERARGMKASSWEIPYEEGSAAKIPNLLAALNAARLMAARGRLALATGDRDTAVASAEALGSLARSHEAESATIVLLIGRAIETLQIELIHEFATSAETTTPELERLQASLCDEDLAHAVRRSLRATAAAIVHEVDAPSWRSEIEGAIHRTIASALSRVVAAAAIDSHRDVEKAIGAPLRTPIDDDAKERGAGWWERLVDSYRINSTSVAVRATATASARDLARLAIVLRRDALANGRYPTTLPAVDDVPADDSLTGEPRVYDVHADGSAELRSTTTEAIVRSITPGTLVFDLLYRWTLPAPRRGALK